MAGVALRGISKWFGKTRVIEKLDLDIRDQEFMVLVGPSGCGKSTALRMIAGLEEASGGDILIGDKVVNQLPPKERDIAMVFQSYALYPHMTVRENMAFGLKIRRTAPADVEKMVAEAARILDIQHLLERRPKELSGGQRQRVAVARALVTDPAVIILDEPVSALDSANRVRTLEFLKELRDSGAALLFISHDLGSVAGVADRIAVLHRGEIVEQGTARAVVNAPEHPYTRLLIRSAPTLRKAAAGRIEGKS